MITVLRLGHRPQRDKRISTHVALAARAYGADNIVVDSHDSVLEDTINRVVKRFGGHFTIQTGLNWKKFLTNSTGVKVHLTMYGMPLDDKINALKEECRQRDLVIIVGAEKVPGEIYGLADHNIAVINQPHSEVSALALFLDRLAGGNELKTAVAGEMVIIPMERGKKVVRSKESPVSLKNQPERSSGSSADDQPSIS